MKTQKKATTRRNELTNGELCKLAQKRPGVIEAKIISPAKVETAGWVRLKCQYGCGGYGSCFTCPPYTPRPDQMRTVLDGYKRAMLIHFGPGSKIKKTVLELEREIFLRGAWKAFGLGAGSCSLCKACALGQKQCRHPESARPSMESCGIDVYTTAMNAGMHIEVVRTLDQCPDFYGLVLVD
jgi:predicted metal-binding protein